MQVAGRLLRQWLSEKEVMDHLRPVFRPDARLQLFITAPVWWEACHCLNQSWLGFKGTHMWENTRTLSFSDHVLLKGLCWAAYSYSCTWQTAGKCTPCTLRNSCLHIRSAHCSTPLAEPFSSRLASMLTVLSCCIWRTMRRKTQSRLGTAWQN